MTEESQWLGFDETAHDEKVEQLNTLLKGNFISKHEYDKRIGVIKGLPVVEVAPVAPDQDRDREIEELAAREAAREVSAVPDVVDPWDSERKGTFFIEWRVTQPHIKAAFAQLQSRLKLAGGGSVQVLQSAAANNMHITMNEFTLKCDEDLQRLKTLLRDNYSMPPSQNVEIAGVGHFNKRVLFAHIKGDALNNCFDDLQRLLNQWGFNPRDRGEFKPHMTLGKLHPRSKAFPDQVFQLIDSLPGSSISFGTQALTEVVLCVKRKKEEVVPPILQYLK